MNDSLSWVEFTLAIHRASSDDEVVQLVCHFLLETFEADGVFIALQWPALSIQSNCLQLTTGLASMDMEFPQQNIIDHISKSFGKFTSYIEISINWYDATVGSLILLSHKKRDFSSEDIPLKAIVEQIALAIYQITLPHQIAKNLHDTFNQSLFAASTIASILPKLLENNLANAKNYIGELDGLLRDASHELSEILDALSRPYGE